MRNLYYYGNLWGECVDSTIIVLFFSDVLICTLERRIDNICVIVELR